MSATKTGGPLRWSLARDKDGHRDYTVVWRVVTTSPQDGPQVVMGASGLPVVGSVWAFGNDSDSYALCWPTLKVTPFQDRTKNYYWEVEQTFSTRPLNRCQDTSITDPLAEPQKVSGSYVRYVKDVEKDRLGKAIKSSSHEPITGIQKDSGRHNVIIEQNVASLGLSTFSAILDTLNDATLWGLPARRIKFSSASWERKLFGTCTYYYTRRFEFEVRNNPDDTFDLDDVADTGYKVFDKTIEGLDTGTDSTDRDNPENFVVYKDRRGSNTPNRILLDGNGDALTDPTNPVFIPTVELYGESNLLVLGIPTSF